MDINRWQRLEALFAEAIALPPTERADFLARACADDPEMRADVESLIEAEEKAAEFLERPTFATAPPAVPRPASLIGQRIGQYHVETLLAEGGMSTVYRAVRADATYVQRVALKVLKHAPDHPELSARFRAERQILASLDHPGIARLLDGGATEDGSPYLVMEYIEGAPLHKYCDQNRLGIDARIDLVRQVCGAVDYAHRNLVVHRDIKPSNILVDSSGMPRLLDFGIAKLLEGAEVPGTTEATVMGQGLMTPEYASPEQVRGAAITTATDIYSMGVVLYVLLTGRLPYKLAGSGPDALPRAVVEQDPERPSVAVAASAEAESALRGLRPAQLQRKLEGDLDNIVLMALRKEPERRYASVALLAEDLRRYHERRPVAAQPDTLGYRARKFVSRHRAAVSAGAIALALILALAATMTVQAVRLARQRDELRAERDKALTLTRLLEQVFAGYDPSEARGEAMTAREVLDRGASRAMAELDDQPETRAALALAIGRVYQSLGLRDRAQPLVEQSLELRHQLFGPDDARVAESLLALALLDQDRGDFAAAEARQREALDIFRRETGSGSARVGDALGDLSSTLIARGKFAEAEAAVREALAVHRKAHGNIHETVAGDLSNLGTVARKLGRLPEAEASHREALAVGRTVFGPVHPKLARQVNNLAVVLNDQGSRAEAESLAREALGITRKLYGARHPDIALQLSNLSAMLLARGDYDGAIAAAGEGLDMRMALFGREHEQVAMSLGSLGDALEQKGDIAEARPLYEEALRIQRKVLGNEHPRAAAVVARLADVSLAQGDVARAEALAREAVATREKALGPAHPDFGSSLVTLGHIRATVRPDDEAEGLLRRGVAILKKALPAGHWRIAEAESRLGACLAARRNAAEAEPLLVGAFEVLLRERGARNARTEAALQRVTAFYAGRGDTAAAAAYRARLSR